MPLFIDSHGATDIGKVRSENQDQFLISDLKKSMSINQTSLTTEDYMTLTGDYQGKLLLVADGMGGHAGGKEASKLAIETIVGYALNTLPWFFSLDPNKEKLKEQLKKSLELCHNNVEAAGKSSGQRKMGTTLTMAYVLWPTLYVIHAGDSRCYLYHSSDLDQMTTDHTVANKLVEEGVMSQKEAEESRFNDVLHNAIGVKSGKFIAEFSQIKLNFGDTLLLCSDGLTKHVTKERIAQFLKTNTSAEYTCQKLIDAANAEGGTDNITAVVARFNNQ